MSLHFKDLLSDSSEYSRLMKMFRPENRLEEKEFLLKKRDGTKLEVQITIHKEEISRKKLLFIYLNTGKSDEELKKSNQTLANVQEQLKQSKNLLESIYRAAPIGIAIVQDRVFKWTNHMLQEITGYSGEELIGMESRFLYPSNKDYEAVGREKLVQMEDRDIVLVETSWKRKDGIIINILLSSTPINLKVPQSDQVLIILEISGQKLVEEALIESEKFAHSIITSIADGLFVLNPDFQYTIWNPAMEKLAKVPKENIILQNKKPWEIFPHLKKVGIDKVMKRAMKGEVILNQEVPYYLQDGISGFTSESYFPLKTPEGKMRGVIGVIHEITERKKAEEALKESRAKLKNFSKQTEQLSLVAASLITEKDEKKILEAISNAIVEYSDYERLIISYFKEEPPYRDIIGYAGVDDESINALRQIETSASWFEDVFHFELSFVQVLHLASCRCRIHRHKYYQIHNNCYKLVIRSCYQMYHSLQLTGSLKVLDPNRYSDP